MSKSGTYKTSDLSLAAYLVMLGLEMKKAQKVDSGKFEFIFDDPNNDAHSMAISYVNSNYCKFDNHIRSIKKLLYSK